MASQIHETDFYAWTQDMAHKLRAGDEIEPDDVELLSQEIEDLGLSEYRSLVTYCTLYLQHRLKSQFQSERQSRSWSESQSKAAVNIQALLEDSPSLRPQLPEIWTKAYKRAVRFASIETSLPRETFPANNPYTLDEVLAEDL